MLCLEDSAQFWETLFEICRLCQVRTPLSLFRWDLYSLPVAATLDVLFRASCVPGTHAIPSSKHLPNEEQSQALG